jgi:hypothetical protein
VAASTAGIPRCQPQPVLPWRLPGPDGAPLSLSFELLQSLVPAAFAIAMLGAIESLLSAVVGDGLAGTKHDPDGELVGQGIGNVVAPFFGGIAATGAIARTATNIRSGAKTPIASFLHALFILAVMLALAPLLGYLPMASLAALLLTVAWRMSEYRHVFRVTRRAPRSDVAVLWVCLLLTVVFDMVIAVSVGSCSRRCSSCAAWRRSPRCALSESTTRVRARCRRGSSSTRSPARSSSAPRSAPSARSSAPGSRRARWCSTSRACRCSTPPRSSTSSPPSSGCSPAAPSSPSAACRSSRCACCCRAAAQPAGKLVIRRSLDKAIAAAREAVGEARLRPRHKNGARAHPYGTRKRCAMRTQRSGDRRPRDGIRLASP